MAAYRFGRIHWNSVSWAYWTADTTLEQEDYYESILEEFDRNPRLGLAGGFFVYEPRRGEWEIRPDKLGGFGARVTGAIFRRG